MFHSLCNKRAKLSDENRCAEGRPQSERVGPALQRWWRGTPQTTLLLSAQRLRPGERFAVQLEFKEYCRPVSLGVTAADPDTLSSLPKKGRELKPSWVVAGSEMYKDGKKVGDWEGNLKPRPGEAVGVTWRGGEVHIMLRGKETPVFTEVPDPVWALLEMDISDCTLSVIPTVQRIPKKIRSLPDLENHEVVQTPNKSKSLYQAYENTELPKTTVPTAVVEENIYANMATLLLDSKSAQGCSTDLTKNLEPDAEPKESLYANLPTLTLQKVQLEEKQTPEIAKKPLPAPRMRVKKTVKDVGIVGDVDKAGSRQTTKPASVLVSCQAWAVCNRYLASLKLTDEYLNPSHNQCFCLDCHETRRDQLCYPRGEPPAPYGLPIGWCRFGLRLSPAAEAAEALKKWHVAFHGTTKENIPDILQSQKLIIPGVMDDDVTKSEAPASQVKEERQTQDANPSHKIFLSPSIHCAECNGCAKPQRWIDPETEKQFRAKVAFQVRVKPDSYNQEWEESTESGQEPTEEDIDNKALDWWTEAPQDTARTGFLVRCEQSRSDSQRHAIIIDSVNEFQA